MTVQEQWKLYEALFEPEQRRVARVAFFTGYSTALADAERFVEECQAVMDALREGKCG